MSHVDPRDVQALGLALLHFVWQGAALGLLLAALHVLLRHAAPPVRYGLAAATLLAMLLAPIATFALVRPLQEPLADAAYEDGDVQCRERRRSRRMRRRVQGPEGEPLSRRPRCAIASTGCCPASSASGAPGSFFSPCGRSGDGRSCSDSSGRGSGRRPPRLLRP